jgi:hypothetical protein
MKKCISLIISLVMLFSLSANVFAYSDEKTIANGPVEQPIALRSLSECHDVLRETGLQSADNDAVPYALVHCETTADVGYYIERLVSSTIIGYETEACTHYIQGHHHIRHQYLDTYEAHCTLCEYTAEFSTLRWSEWSCVSG